MSAHTPTPWIVAYGNSVCHVRGGNGASLVTTVGGRDAEANAAFIVTACNAHDALVAALRECVKELRYANVNPEGEQRIGTTKARVIESARAALAKVQA